MLNAPVPLFLNIRALVFRRSSSITASETEAAGDVHPGLGDDRRIVGRLLGLGRRREHRIAGLERRLGKGGLGMTVLEPPLVAAQLLLDPVGRLLEGDGSDGGAPAEPFSTTPCGT